METAQNERNRPYKVMNVIAYPVLFEIYQISNQG